MSELLLLKMVDDRVADHSKHVDEQLSIFNKKLTKIASAIPDTLASVRKQSEEGALTVLNSKADELSEVIRSQASEEIGGLREDMRAFTESALNTFRSRNKLLEAHAAQTDAELVKLVEASKELQEKLDTAGKNIDDSLSNIFSRISDLEQYNRQTPLSRHWQRLCKRIGIYGT